MLQALAASFMAVLAVGNTQHQRGVELYKQHKYAEAASALEEASSSEAASSPEFKESALLIGQSYFMLWLEKVRTTNEANYMLGYAYLQNNQHAESEAAFARLFGVKPDSAEGHLVAAQMLVKKGFEDYAAGEARKAVEMDPKLPGAHFLLGEMAIYVGRLEEGLSEMTTEISLNPTFSMAWYRRGDAYTRQGKWDAAIPDLQVAVWLNPNFSGPYILLGKCYFKTASYANAEGMLRHALELDPRNYSATYLLGETLMNQGKKDEGREVLERLKTLRQTP
jgi:tetratricopeptide (TPR) repeat protein